MKGPRYFREPASPFGMVSITAVYAFIIGTLTGRGGMDTFQAAVVGFFAAVVLLLVVRAWHDAGRIAWKPEEQGGVPESGCNGEARNERPDNREAGVAPGPVGSNPTPSATR